MLTLPRRLLLLGLALACTHAGAGAAPVGEPAPFTLPRSEVRAFASTATGHEHRVFIAWPEGPTPVTGFPVIYVLDANAWFGTVVEISRMLAGRPEGTGVGPAIIVGLGYPIDKPFDNARRTLDYTPASADPTAARGESGGADAFLRFIEDEVKPAIARDHPIDVTRQTLVGHSFGGLFVLHVLLTRPAAFQNYVALSPSIWWGERALLAGEPSFPARLASANVGATGPRSVFISAAQYEQTPDPARASSPERIAKLQKNRMIDNARELAARLAAIPGTPLRVQFTEFPGENHGSVVPGAISRALPFLFTGPR